VDRTDPQSYKKDPQFTGFMITVYVIPLHSARGANPRIHACGIATNVRNIPFVSFPEVG
jgi:hypothetical protein